MLRAAFPLTRTALQMRPQFIRSASFLARRPRRAFLSPVTHWQQMRRLSDKASKEEMLQKVDKGTAAPPPSTIVRAARAAKKGTSYVFVYASVGLLVAVSIYAVRQLSGMSPPQMVFNKAQAPINENERVSAAVGTPITFFADGKRRRDHLRSREFEHEGVKHCQVRFYVEGPRGKGVVHAEMLSDPNHEGSESGSSFFGGSDWEWNFLIVEIPRQRPIHVVDNRIATGTTSQM